MPCFLFTYHAHGSWLPDRSRGYVRRKEGIQVADANMAACYRRNLKQAVVVFDKRIQAVQITGVLEACTCLAARCHGIGTDGSHIHLLVSWNSERSWESVSEAIKSSLTRRLNKQVYRQKWFSKGSSRKRVRDRSHYEYLLTKYLPSHRGLCWSEFNTTTVTPPQ